MVNFITAIAGEDLCTEVDTCNNSLLKINWTKFRGNIQSHINFNVDVYLFVSFLYE